jgi:hypothetical protein
MKSQSRKMVLLGLLCLLGLLTQPYPCMFILTTVQLKIYTLLNDDAGDGMAGMKQGDLIIWYVEQQNAKGAYSSTAEVKEEVKCIKAIIEVSPALLNIWVW